MSGERRNVVTALGSRRAHAALQHVKQMSESKAVIGLNMLTLWKDRGTLAPWIAPLRECSTTAPISPVVAAAFPLRADRRGAQTMIVERRNVGKVVLTPA